MFRSHLAVIHMSVVLLSDRIYKTSCICIRAFPCWRTALSLTRKKPEILLNILMEATRTGSITNSKKMECMFFSVKEEARGPSYVMGTSKSSICRNETLCVVYKQMKENNADIQSITVGKGAFERLSKVIR